MTQDTALKPHLDICASTIFRFYNVCTTGTVYLYVTGHYLEKLAVDKINVLPIVTYTYIVL